jgi:hypothetical protein
MMRGRALAPILAVLAFPAGADEPLVMPVLPLAAPPAIDGSLAEWGSTGWIKVPITPAVPKEDRAKLGLAGEDSNFTGTSLVQLKAGVSQGRLYLAARWPDDAPNTEYKGWDWRGDRYVESKKREDMFAVRFHLDGDFDRSMLSGKTYRVDVWLWSAARTDPLALAEDMLHSISSKQIEDAAEYSLRDRGTLYIKKQRDAGGSLYQNLRAPKELATEHLPGVKLSSSPGGSIADVKAKGLWKGGFWNLELSRQLDTGNADDVRFRPGQKILGQIAVFNRGWDEHKSVSEPLLFDFSQVR